MSSQRTWADDEPGLGHALGELVRLYRRALRRPLLVLLIAAGLAAGIGGFVLLKKLVYAPRYVLRAIETDYNAATAPRPKRKLREFVQDGVFTHSRLLDLIQKHGLYPSLTKKNPRAAVESFREDISVEVYRNYFVEERSPYDAPRSARIAIRYMSIDPRLALAVTRDLGQMIVEQTAAVQQKRTLSAQQLASKELEKAQLELSDVQMALAAAQRRWAQSTGVEEASATVELIELAAEQTRLELQLDHAGRRKVELDLNAALEQQDMGLHFEVVDDGAVADASKLRQTHASMAAFLAFLFGLPLVALGVGAFDARVRSTDDLLRLRLRSLGELKHPLGAIS
jgi:hypothetical protein